MYEITTLIVRTILPYDHMHLLYSYAKVAVLWRRTLYLLPILTTLTTLTVCTIVPGGHAVAAVGAAAKDLLGMRRFGRGGAPRLLLRLGSYIER